MDKEDTPSEDPKTTESCEPEAEGIRRIGPYRLLQKIGEGGMGEVYEAEQDEPVRRRVALKIIKPGMDSRQVLARFEAERQALALMDHPNIARVFDAGADDRGRPYFAMEFVRGVPITEHCDRRRLTTRERLEVFMRVCDGVQHAHQKGIIHRDIKPSNVLVQAGDGKRTPKIIDFGVAKATAQRLTERTLFTELGVLIGTPEYMSPEQAELTAEDIDTRSDVYSLGVLLYELLVGALPFDARELREGGFDEIRRKIRDDEPSRPSTRLGTLKGASTESATRRRTDVRTLRRQLSGDLDWITMRALEKDRARRYGSPSELAEDLRRHLRHEPVVAGPPSTAYRARKFVRRHRVGVGVTVLMLGVLVAFLLTTTVQSRRIAREARTSERVSEFMAELLGNVDAEEMGLALWQYQRERAEEIRRARGATDNEIENVLASLDDGLSGVNATDVALRLLDEQILSRAGKTIEQELAGEPRIAGRLEHTIGVTYRRLGMYKQAEPHAKRALEIRERELGRGHPDTLTSISTLGLLYLNQSRDDEAEPLLLEALAARQRVLGDDHPDTLNSMNLKAILYDAQGRRDEAGALYVKTLESLRRVLGEDHPYTLTSMHELSSTYADRGHYDQAEALILEALETKRIALGEDHPGTLRSANLLALILVGQRRYDEAEKVYLDTLEARRRVLGTEHPTTLISMNNLAGLYMRQGRYAKAEPLILEALQVQRAALGETHKQTLSFKNQLAVLFAWQGRHDEAEALHLETLEGRRRALGENHPSTLASIYNLACLAVAQGEKPKAIRLLREALRRGFDQNQILDDPDLAPLRGDPEFESMVAEVKARIGDE